MYMNLSYHIISYLSCVALLLNYTSFKSSPLLLIFLFFFFFGFYVFISFFIIIIFLKSYFKFRIGLVVCYICLYYYWLLSRFVERVRITSFNKSQSLNF